MGSFLFTVVSCRGVRGFELVGRTDPYVLLKYGQHKFMTHADNEAGEDANFFLTFQADADPKVRLLAVQVWDRGWALDELLGSALMELVEVVDLGHGLFDIPLTDSRGMDNGFVRIAIKYSPSSDSLDLQQTSY